jgi:hypothetical protein
VAQLRSQLLELRSVLEARSIQPTIASPAASSQPETPTQELGVRLEQTLQREPQTLEARRVADALGASILRVLPQRASLLQITCVASLCRAEIAYANAEQWQSFIETQLGGADNSFWPGPVYLQLLSNPPPPQGEVRALLYLGRGAGSFETRQDG